MEYFIGLMSGTSVDAIDAVLCKISKQADTESITLINSLNYPIALNLQQKIHKMASASYQSDPIDEMAQLDVEIGLQLSNACNALLEQSAISSKQIIAIGSHGQTIRHKPNLAQAFSLQIGDPNTIVANTNITTIADFRRRDVAYGGQGAPLVPAFHSCILSNEQQDRVILNLGGIANITLLSNSQEIIGYDTGPANTLMDQWISKHLAKTYDFSGDWAKGGALQTDLLAKMLSDPYFSQPAPKSTGREYFNLNWLEQQLTTNYKAQDVQRTLLELTAQSIVNEVTKHLPSGAIYVCGGGTHNQFLMQRLQQLAPHLQLHSTQKLGVAPDWVEAMAFAWLAYRTLNGLSGSLTRVTGARQQSVLGAIYPK